MIYLPQYSYKVPSSGPSQNNALIEYKMSIFMECISFNTILYLFTYCIRKVMYLL